MADEVERMITATRRSDGRLAKREALLIMTAYRLASELIAQRWDEIDLKAGHRMSRDSSTAQHPHFQ
jgi:integrase